MSEPLEQEIMNQCLDWLRLRGFFVWRQNQGAMRIGGRFIRMAHITGISDIIGIVGEGRFLAIEVKRPGKKPTPEQARFLEMVTKRGGLALVVHSLDEMVQLLSPYSNSTCG